MLKYKILLITYLLISFNSISYSQSGWVLTNFNLNYQSRAIISHNENIYYGILGGGIEKSTDNGETVTLISGGVPDVNVISLLHRDNDLFVGTVSMGIFRTTNEGYNWSQKNNGLPINWSVNNITSAGSYLYLNTFRGIFCSSDNGENWVSITSNLPDTTIRTIYSYDSFLFTGVTINGVYSSTNNGISWFSANNGLPTNSTPWCFCKIKDTLFVSIYGYGIYKSINNGMTWTPTNDEYKVRITLAMLNKDNYLFLGTHTYGVYYSSNYGNSWIAINEGIYEYQGIPAFAVNSIYIFAGTFGNGVYRRLLSEIIGIKTSSEFIPKSFSLSQNYPNPFNPTTKIIFDIPPSKAYSLVEGARGIITRLTICDILGREVAVVVNEQLTPGTYEVQWNAENNPSGIYFYRLESGAFIETKKMVLMK